jgi:DNA-binding PadR family transcriptional regulator
VDVTKGNYLGEFEMVVLLALARLDQPASGMPIYDEICRTTGRDVSVHSVYVTLGRMENKRYVSSSVGEQENDTGSAGKQRKCYALSEQGVAALQRSRDMYENLWAGVSLNAGTS